MADCACGPSTLSATDRGSSGADISLAVGQKLLEAEDTDGIVAAAGVLLDEVVPGAVLRRCDLRSSLAVVAGAPGRTVRIALPNREVLVAVAPVGGDRRDVLRSIAALVEARVDLLYRHDALLQSIHRLKRAERLQRALYSISEQAADTGDLTGMFKALHAIVSGLVYAANFFIARYDADSDSVTFPYFVDTVEAAPNLPSRGSSASDSWSDPAWSMADFLYSPTWYVIRQGRPLMGSPDALRHQVGGPYRPLGATSRDWLGVPLLGDDGVAGCVVVQSYDEAHRYDDEDRALLVFVARHIQLALERRSARAELEHRVAERTVSLSTANRSLQREVRRRQRSERLQAALFRITELAVSVQRTEDFYPAVHCVVSELMYARNFFLAVLNNNGTQLSFPYVADERDTAQPPRELAHGLTEYVLRRGVPLLADRAVKADLVATGEVLPRGAASESWLGVPLTRDGQTIGVLGVQSYTADHMYTERDQEVLTFVSFHIATALERVRTHQALQDAYRTLEQRVAERTHELLASNERLHAQIAEREEAQRRLRYEALHDPLTKLPNGGRLMQELGAALDAFHADPARGFAVLCMDLDRFKVINDSIGHLVGDNLLVQVAVRLRACVQPRDLVARLGGDEFVVLLNGVGDAAYAEQIAARVIETIAAPFHLAEREVCTSISIGIVMPGPRHAQADALLRDADGAMYRAKDRGRRTFVVADDAMHREDVERLELEGDLRRGLSQGEFVPYYQPIVDLADDRVVGYEALLRWRHPERGVLSPEAFLAAADGAGISEAIDWSIFEQVCQDAGPLLRDGDAFVSVNLSPAHFRHDGLAGRMLGLMSEHGLEPSRICVEITERVTLEGAPGALETLRQLRNGGVRIALDDFGTGYSSLSYLQKYPVQLLKIDRSFIDTPAEPVAECDGVLIRTIVAMAKALSMRVLAEGVETPAQHDRLRAMGCEWAQGFLHGRPQPLEAWVARG